MYIIAFYAFYYIIADSEVDVSMPNSSNTLLKVPCSSNNKFFNSRSFAKYAIFQYFIKYTKTSLNNIILLLSESFKAFI